MLLPIRFQRPVPIILLGFLCLFYYTQYGIHKPPLGNNSPHQPQPHHSNKQPPDLPLLGPDADAEHTDPGAGHQRPAPANTHAQCSPDLARLRAPELGLSSSILYTRRCIKPAWAHDAPRDDVTKLNGPLIDRQTAVNLSSCTSPDNSDGGGAAEIGDLGPCKPILFNVPYPAPEKKYPHLVMGVSTTYDRMKESLPAFSHWLSGSGTLMVAVVVDALPDVRSGEDGEPAKAKDLRALEELYRKSGMEVRCVAPRRPDIGVDKNHFTMLEDLLGAVGSETKWIGLLDDDTFFPILHNLDAELSKHDHTKPMWLGALSEDLAAIKRWGLMAFGGAGVFVSVPLARELVPLIDRCLHNADFETGDGILRDCMFAETHTKLTIVPGLYQHDMMGDMAGFYESGVRPLSVHHWKSWYEEPIVKMATVTNLCGDCFLQRWQFGEDTLLANGYSVVRYPQAGGLADIDLTRMETTWNAPTGHFDWSVGPVRRRLPDGRKKTYKLREVFTMPDGEFRQVYVHQGNAEAHEVDEVVELVWKA